MNLAFVTTKCYLNDHMLLKYCFIQYVLKYLDMNIGKIFENLRKNLKRNKVANCLHKRLKLGRKEKENTLGSSQTLLRMFHICTILVVP